MSGLSGVWNLDGKPMDAHTLPAMNAALRHRGRDGERCSIVGAIGLAHQHNWITPEEVGERQPLAGRHTLVVFDGRLDNRAELLRVLALPPAISDAQLVVGAYEAWGDRLAEHLAGEFALAVHDSFHRRLVIARDALGLRPLYYFRSDRLFVFASEIKAILAHPGVEARPDDEGLADFMLISSRRADNHETTCFAGISALPPAHVAVVEPKRFAKRRFWDFEPGRSIQLKSVREYAEAFREHFVEAVRRRLRSVHPVAVSVSGGLDSSAIFCQAQKLLGSAHVSCPRVLGFAYVGARGGEADERAYLREIEREHGERIEQFNAEPLVGVVQNLDEQIAAAEAPFVDCLWGINRELHRRAAACGTRVLLSGSWGDQLFFSSAYLVDFFHRLRWNDLTRHLREFGLWFGAVEGRVLARRFFVDVARHDLPRWLVPPFKWARRRLFGGERPKPWFSRRFLNRGFRHANTLATLGQGFHSAQARAIYFEARSKYHVHCIEWHNKGQALHGLEAGLPVLDRDLIAYLMAIPGDAQNPAGVPRGLLREAMRGVLPDAIRTRKSKGNFTALVNAGVSQDAPAIRRALSSDGLGVRLGYLDAVRLEPVVDQLAARGQSAADSLDSWDLSDLLGFDAWLRIFLVPTGLMTHAPGGPQESV